jgi:hypothetical protein
MTEILNQDSNNNLVSFTRWKQKQGANETAKNAKDKSDKEASRLNRLRIFECLF